MGWSKTKITANLAKLLAFLIVLEGFLFVSPAVDNFALAATQNAWRWRNDDGTEATATWKAAENAPITGVDKNVPQRLRFGVANTTDEDELVAEETLTLQKGNSNVETSVIDTEGGYVYFGTYTAPPRIIKIRLSDDAYMGYLEITDVAEELGWTSAIDMSGTTNYAYFSSYGNPGTIVKVNLDTFTVDSSLVLNSGEHAGYALALDTAAGYGYAGIASSPLKIVKFRLSDMSRVATITADSGYNWAYSIELDTAAGKGYVGTGTSPGSVLRFDLSSFSFDGSVTLLTGESYLTTLVVDSNYIYAGTDTSRTAVIRISKPGLTRTDKLVFATGESYTVKVAYDSGSSLAYYTTDTYPGKVVKVDLAAFSRISALTFNTYEDEIYSLSIDPSGGNGYVGFWTSPGRVAKFSLSAMTRTSGQVLPDAGDAYLGYCVAVDDGNGYVYAATGGIPGTVVKIRLSDYSVVGRVDLVGAEGGCGTLLPDYSGGFLYTAGSSGYLVKIRLSDFTRVTSMALPAGQTNISSGVIDTANGYLYLGSSDSPAEVHRVRLSDFSLVGTVILAGEGDMDGAAIDTANGYAYFAAGASPARVVKVDIDPLRTFQYVGTAVFGAGTLNAQKIVVDPGNDNGYVCTWQPTQARVLKFALSTLTPTAEILMPSGGDYCNSAAIDTGRGYAYFGTQTYPSRLYQVDINPASTFQIVGSLIFTPSTQGNQGSAISTVNGYLYMTSWTTPGALTRVSILPHRELKLEYGLKETSCAAVTQWIPVSAGAAWQPAASGYLTDGAVTTDSSGLTNGAATFVAGYAETGDGVTGTVPLFNDRFTEVEYSVEATLGAQNGATYCFRVNDEENATIAFSGYAEATLAASYAPVTQSSGTVRRSKAGEATSFDMQFTLPSAQSTQFVLTFPSGFTVNSAFTSGTCSGGGTIGNFAVGSNAVTITADKSSCSGTVTLSGASITLPSQAGIYRAYYVNDSPGEVVIPVTDDDQVSVTGSVDPTLSFDLDVSTGSAETAAPYAVDFGSVAAGSPEASDNSAIPSIWIDLATNASGGAAVRVASANAALKSTSAPADSIASVTQALSAGTETYGICVDPALSGTQDGGDLFVAVPPYSGTCDGTSATTVGLLQSAAQNILAASGPISAGRAQIRVGVAVENSTPAHPDYSDILTFTATATF